MSALLEPEVVANLERRIGPVPVPRRRRRTMHAGELLFDLSRQTLANLRRNKLRSFLTLFGIAWGIASLVLMSALSDGFRQGQRKNMAQIGDNIVFAYGGVTEEQAGGQRAGRRIFLYERDLEVIRATCPAVEVVSAEHKTYQVPARSATNAGRFLTLGVNPDYLKLRNLPVERGRAVSGADVRETRRVAVLGASVRKQLFEKKPLPLGEQIFINNYPYEVIGVMSEKDQNSSYDGWDNDKILIPTSALLRDLPASRKVYAEGRIDGFLYRPVNVAQWEEAQAQVRLVTLSLGGVGVMNTMMMAVSERTNEIGLKKALGATSGRILMDFFLEGVFLALLSGCAGLLITWALSSAVNALPLPAMFSGLPIHWTMLAFATAALGLVAVGSALPPARHAAAMTPVEALRHER
ncbi:MAG: ABC transporter permease [Acidobacteria bacterium]|nr:ABC transporter permease [Acidobacteriota bacterium]